MARGGFWTGKKSLIVRLDPICPIYSTFLKLKRHRIVDIERQWRIRNLQPLNTPPQDEFGNIRPALTRWSSRKEQTTVEFCFGILESDLVVQLIGRERERWASLLHCWIIRQMICWRYFFWLDKIQTILSVVVGLYHCQVRQRPITPFLNISPLCFAVVSQRGWITPISDDRVKNRRCAAFTYFSDYFIWIRRTIFALIWDSVGALGCWRAWYDNGFLCSSHCWRQLATQPRLCRCKSPLRRCQLALFAVALAEQAYLDYSQGNVADMASRTIRIIRYTTLCDQHIHAGPGLVTHSKAVIHEPTKALPSAGMMR